MPPRVAAPASSAVARPLRAASQKQQGTASFSTSARRQGMTGQRKRYAFWAKSTVGKHYRFGHDTPGPKFPIGSLKVGKQETRFPFPNNSLFRAPKVLNDGGRELIWEKVMRGGESIKAVSAELGVDINRVAAVVRLKEVEKEWESKGKFMAKPYATAVSRMLPVHQLSRNSKNRPLEAINEMHVHSKTLQQIFWPTSESRQFTRADAAKVFDNHILPADKRVPHPELVEMERSISNGVSPWEASAVFKKTAAEAERKAAEKQAQAALKAEEGLTRKESGRFEFRFKDYDSSRVGQDGRARNAPGWKYGAPHYDRSKGQIKIPTSVP